MSCIARLQVIHDGFNPDYGLFAATREGQLHPGSQAVHMDQGPGLLEFIGMMVGKAMYEGMLVDLPLAPFFILRLQVCRAIPFRRTLHQRGGLHG
jgi:hypothetical protein